MRCAQVIGLTTEHLENALPLVRRRRMERHLAGCPACTAHLVQTQVLVSIARRPYADEVPDEVVDEIVALYCRLRMRPSGSPRRPG